jgi:hypothetical protein
MKKIILVLGLFISVSTLAFAQGRMQMGTPEERSTRQLVQLEPLKLNADQKVKLASIFLWSAQQIDSVRTTLNGDFSAMRTKMMPIQDQTTKMINLVLNDEQRKAYEAILEERRARMRNNQ